jgi:hypothetical protein
MRAAMPSAWKRNAIESRSAPSATTTWTTPELGGQFIEQFQYGVLAWCPEYLASCLHR